MATLDLTNFCNFKCVHCCRINDKTSDLPTEEWEKILKQYLENDVKIVFAGGEPLVFKDLPNLLRIIREFTPKDDQIYAKLVEGVATPDELFELVDRNRVAITTNGHFLDVHADMLEELGVVVWLSLDAASKDLFESIRVKSDFDQLLRNLQLIRERIPVHVNFVVLEQNRHEVLDIVSRLDEMDLNLVRFTPVREVVEARKNSIRVFHQSYIDCIKDVLEYMEKKPHRPKLLAQFNLMQTQKIYLLHHGLYDGLMERVAQSPNVFVSEKTCDFNKLDRSVVNPKGSYTGCCNASSMPAFAMGNMLEDGLEISRSNQQVINIFETTPQLCKTCSYLKLCKGGCRLMSHERFGDPLLIDPTCPFLDEKLANVGQWEVTATV